MASGSADETLAAGGAGAGPPRAWRAAGFLPWLAFLVLLAASWNRWMEPFVDTGRELMVPRRVAEGERLYRDVQFFHGPLAPYAVGLLERTFPGSFAARTAFALAFAAAALEVLRRLGRAWMPGVAGGLAAALSVALPFFLRPGGWMCPFSVDTSIAIAALMAMLLLLRRGEALSRSRDVAAAACLTAALLSRPELGLAGIAAAALDLRRSPRRLSFVAGLPLAISAAVYTAISAGIPREKLIADGWLAILRPPQAFQNVYRAFAGLDRPLLRAGELGLAAILLLLAGCAVVIGAAASERLRTKSSGAAFAANAAVLIGIAASALVFRFPPDAWSDTLALFPPLVRLVPGVCALVLGARLLVIVSGNRARDWASPISDGALLLAALFGARLFLAAGYAGPYNAFFLPLPILVACAALTRIAEKGARTVGRSLPALVSSSLAILLAVSVAGLVAAYRGPGWERVETPSGAILLGAVQARTTALALADLERRVHRGGTLVGFPEAGFFNYVLGARNPLPLDQFWPGHLDAAGEDRVARALAARPPDTIVLVNALAVGEGLRAFGTDYSKSLGRSLDSSTRPAATFGPNARAGAKIGDADFFIQVRVPVAPRVKP